MITLVTTILLVIGAYLVGSIPSAYLIARWRRGIDIRQYGSGNVGAANVLATVSKRWSIVVTIFDVGKGALMVWIAQLLELGIAQQTAVGIAAIIGHNWPVFLRFQGGRGVFTSLGVITMLSPWLGLIALVFPYLFAPFRQISLGVTLVLIVLPLTGWFFGRQLNIAEPLPVTLGIVIILVIMSLRRLTAPRSPISASVPTSELMFNRFLFDRDIRDRKVWISQKRSQENPVEQPPVIEERQEKT
jgi:glycerol-3-phosphate acyltransferase PlsY